MKSFGKEGEFGLGNFKLYQPSFMALSYPQLEKQFETNYVPQLEGIAIRPLREPKRVKA
jgi:hypothetical protein